MWQYNYHEDFVPYYDDSRGKWAISIQYLNVWFFNTEKQAISRIPSLKAYRERVLQNIEEQNKEYYKKFEEEEKIAKKILQENRLHISNIKKLCSALSNEEKKKLEKMLDKGYSDEVIMAILGISKRAVALKRYHRYK